MRYETTRILNATLSDLGLNAYITGDGRAIIDEVSWTVDNLIHVADMIDHDKIVEDYALSADHLRMIATMIETGEALVSLKGEQNEILR